MDEELNKKFLSLTPSYKRLGENITTALSLFFKEHEVDAFSVTFRVKSYESFAEKIERKDYEHAFDETEDLVGVRVILYYQDEVERVSKVIDKEFDIHTSEDKSAALGEDKFGYRSYHKIVTIPKKWLDTPNYRGLENLKCEIQIRTILMHAWAEIEHKLQYKNESSVPSVLKRKLFRLSAKFEDADEQFQELRDKAADYRASLPSQFHKKSSRENEIELNADTVQLFLKKKYPDRNRAHYSLYASLVEQLKRLDINSIGALDKALDVATISPEEYEEEKHAGQLYYLDVGMVRYSLDVYERIKVIDKNR